MHTRVMLVGWTLASGIAVTMAQTKVDLRSQSKSIDFSGATSTKPVKSGSALPATCSVGELFFHTGASPGSNIYVCAAANTWTSAAGGNAQTGAGAPAIGCAAGQDTYLDTTNLDYWICDVTDTWKKLLSTTNSGPFSLTGQTGTPPATPAAGLATIYLNSDDKTIHTMSDAGTDMRYAGLGEANVWGAFLQDFRQSTFLIPTAAGLTTTTNGGIGYDSTGNQIHAAISNADAIIPTRATSTPASGNCVKWGANGQLQDQGAACSAASTADSMSAVLKCAAASASGAAYTCSTSPTFVPATQDMILFKADVANTGSAALNVNSSSAATIKKQGGGTNLVANDLLAGQWVTLIYDGANWQMQGQTGNPASGSGDSITVNGVAVVDANLNDTTPAAVSSTNPGRYNLTVQKDSSSPTNIALTLPLVRSDTFELIDDMCTGSSTTGLVAKGWVFAGGSVTASPGVANHPCIVERNTAGTTGTVAYMAQTTGTGGEIAGSENFYVNGIIDATAAITNRTVRIGLGDGTGTGSTWDPPTNGIYVERLGTSTPDADWFGVVRGASAQTRIDLGVALAADTYHNIKIWRVDSSTIAFKVDGGSVICLTSAGSLPTGCATGTTSVTAGNVPNSAMRMFNMIKNDNSSTTNMLLDVDYMSLVVTGLTR